MTRWLSALVAVPIFTALCGCMGVRYIPQAASGQLGLMTAGRKLEKAASDPETPPEIRRLLREVTPIRAFGAARGLDRSRSYRRYVALNREYVVWFVTGSHPLAFQPKVYWFPIAGSFAGVGWFNPRRAERHVERLESEGLDAASRGASAYSTGGWFRDPVVSSMLETGPAAVGDLANVLLHESVHATVLVNGQTYFNESLASFVADTMTPEYLVERFGRQSAELQAYEELAEIRKQREAEVLAAYTALETLYASDRPTSAKLAQKRALLDTLQAELDLEQTPNNASLLGAKLYGTGMDELALLLSTCRGDWKKFVQAVGSLLPSDFATPQLEDFGPVVRTLVAWQCTPLR